MVKTSLARKALIAVCAVALAVAALMVVGCSCSSNSASSSSASASSSSASSSASSSSALKVPNVVSLSQSEAEKAITSAGLVVGDVKKESSDSVPQGNVISQDPKALESAKKGDKVNLVVSSGKAEAKDVEVPDLKGMTKDEAEKTLADVKLVGVASSPEETTEVEAGKVFKQSIAAGTTVKEGEKVTFTVAAEPKEVEVPDVEGMTLDEAKEAITDEKLSFGSSSEYDDDVDEGLVISQSIDAGTKVKVGTAVSVVVSKGPKPPVDVEVPDLEGDSWQEAKSELESANLKAGYTGDEDGRVTSQDVAAGTMVAPGTTVTVTLEAEDDGQDAIMNFIGTYGANRATIKVNPAGDGEAAITVEWASSAAETSTWEMTGPFDADTLTVSYSGGTKTNIVFGEDGKVESEEVVYTDGTGTFTFDDSGSLSLTWNDKKEHVADGVTFDYV